MLVRYSVQQQLRAMPIFSILTFKVDALAIMQMLWLTGNS